MIAFNRGVAHTGFMLTSPVIIQVPKPSKIEVSNTYTYRHPISHRTSTFTSHEQHALVQEASFVTPSDITSETELWQTNTSTDKDTHLSVD